MADYIDRYRLREKLNFNLERWEDSALEYKEDKSGAVAMKDAIYELTIAPAADVVPKSEVESLQDEAENLRNANADLALALLYECEPTKERLSELEKVARQKVAREIFDEIEKRRDKIHGIVLLLPEEIAELKKKYTGETE